MDRSHAWEVMNASVWEVDEFNVRMPKDKVLSDPAELTMGTTTMYVLVVQGIEGTRYRLVSVIAQQVMDSVEDSGNDRAGVDIEGLDTDGFEAGDEVEGISVDKPSWEVEDVETKMVDVKVPDVVHLVSVVVIDVVMFAKLLVMHWQEGFGKISPLTAVSTQTQPLGVEVGMADVAVLEGLD